MEEPFFQLLNVHGFNNVRLTKIYTAEPLVSEPSAFEFEMATEKLKRHKSPGIDQMAAELIKTWGRKIHLESHKLINSISNQEELAKESIIVPIHKKGDKTDCTNYTGISLLSTTYTVLSKILL